MGKREQTLLAAIKRQHDDARQNIALMCSLGECVVGPFTSEDALRAKINITQAAIRAHVAVSELYDCIQECAKEAERGGRLLAKEDGREE